MSANATYDPAEKPESNLHWKCPGCGTETYAAASGKPAIFPVVCFCGNKYTVRVNY